MAQKQPGMQSKEFLTFSGKNRPVEVELQRVRDMDGVPVITIFESGQGYVMAGNGRMANAILLGNDAVVVECDDIFPDGLCVERASNVYPMAHRRARNRW